MALSQLSLGKDLHKSITKIAQWAELWEMPCRRNTELSQHSLGKVLHQSIIKIDQWAVP